MVLVIGDKVYSVERLKRLYDFLYRKCIIFSILQNINMSLKQTRFMVEEPETRLIFQIHFNWPKEQTQEMYKNARKLYDLAVEADWIKDVIGASGAIGSERSSFWMFTISSYGDLDNIFLQRDDELSKTYYAFMNAMEDVVEYIYHQVAFI
jgi:hypothetical protein